MRGHPDLEDENDFVMGCGYRIQRTPLSREEEVLEVWWAGSDHRLELKVTGEAEKAGGRSVCSDGDPVPC